MLQMPEQNSITIEVDQPKDGHVLGGTVSGKVHIQLDKAQPCHALNVRLWYALYGKQDETDQKEVVAEKTLYQGNLSEKACFDFSLQVPNYPLTFNGDTVWIVWKVTAEIDWSRWNSEELRSTEVVEVGPSKFSRQHEAHEPAGPYRQAAQAIPIDQDPTSGVSALWRCRDAISIASFLNKRPQQQALLKRLERSDLIEEGKAKARTAWEIVIAIVVGVPILLVGIGGTLLGFSSLLRGQISTGIISLLIFGLALCYMIFMAKEFLQEKWRHFHNGRISIDYLLPPRVALLGEKPTTTVRIRTQRAISLTKVVYEFRHRQCAVSITNEKRKGNKYAHKERTEKWEHTYTHRKELMLPTPPHADGAGITFDLQGDIPNAGPSTTISPTRQISYEFRVWLEGPWGEKTEGSELMVLPAVNMDELQG
jgi:hypothetical protein